MKNRAQFGVIAVSASLLVLSGVLAYGLVESFAQTNLFETDGGSITHNISVPISYEKHINQGDQLYARGYYELAAESYQSAIEESDEHAEAYEKLGFAYSKLNQNEEAAMAFQGAHQRSSSTLHGSYYVSALINLGDFDTAQNVLGSLDQEAQEVLYAKSLLSLLQSEFTLAREQLEAAQSLQGHTNPEHIQTILNVFTDFDAQQGGQEVYLNASLSKAMIDVEQYKIAESLALMILQENSDYRDVWSILGYAKLQIEDYSGAEDAFKQAKALDPIKPEIHYFLGSAHYFQSEYEEATDSLN